MCHESRILASRPFFRLPLNEKPYTPLDSGEQDQTFRVNLAIEGPGRSGLVQRWLRPAAPRAMAVLGGRQGIRTRTSMSSVPA